MFGVLCLNRIPDEEGAVLNALRSKRNRPYLRVLMFVLLASWVSILVSATCSMPAPWRLSSADSMPAGCSEAANHSQGDKGQGSPPVHDCSFKPCLDSQPNPVFGYKLDKPDLPVFLLPLIWIIGSLLFDIQARRIPRTASPPDGRRIPLIYRFCILLD